MNRIPLLLVLVFACRSAVLPGSARVKGVNTACLSDTECRLGLACTSGTCQPNASLQSGEKCDVTLGCADGLYCSAAQTCAPAGTLALNQPCRSSADCTRGLFCGLVGVLPVCQTAGAGDVKAACTTSADCMAGLGCAVGLCTAGAPTLAPPVFTGVDCAADSGDFRAYFEVPAAGQALPDFFRLPFPNDARADLTGFPRPASGPIGDLLAQYVQAAESEINGASNNPTVTLRTSGEINRDTLSYNQDKITDPSSGMLVDPSTLFFYEIRRSAPGETLELDASGCDTRESGWTFGTVSAVVSWQRLPSRTPYICQNSLSFRPRTDAPLKSNALYMFVVTTGVQSPSAQPLKADADLTAVLSTSTPEARLTRAHGCYAPARGVFGASGFPFGASKVASMTLFHTQNAVEPAAAVIRGVRAAPTEAQPKITKLVRCGTGVTSPCADPLDTSRSCAADNSAFDEYHGQMVVPVMQRGTRPYQTADGYIEYNSDRRYAQTGDTAKVQGSESLCFSVTVPKTVAPTGIVIYGHGTGGNFRSFVNETQVDQAGNGIPSKTIAADMAEGGLAVISFDQPMHGPRRNSTFTADTLYFNVNNPRAMRDNPLQAVADYEQVLGTLKAVSAGTTVFAADIDSTLRDTFRGQIAGLPRVFMGHSQGGQNGLPWLALTQGNDVKGGMLSGTGGGLIQALLQKQQPVDFKTLLPGALTDTALNTMHPVLNLMQSVGDRADPINFGSVMNGRASLFPPTAAAAFDKSLFHVIGVNDTFTPLRTSSDLVAAMRIPAFAIDGAVENAGTIGGFESGEGERTKALDLLSDASKTGSTSGLLCNCTSAGRCTTSTSLSANFTAGAVVYAPETGKDGHFVLFQNGNARTSAKQFLTTTVASPAGFCAPTGGVSPTISD